MMTMTTTMTMVASLKRPPGGIAGGPVRMVGRTHDRINRGLAEQPARFYVRARHIGVLA